MKLALRRASTSRVSGHWNDEDYDVFDGDRMVGGIHLMAGGDWWHWSLAFPFQLSGKKRYGREPTLDSAKVAFRAEYERAIEEKTGRNNP